MLHMQFFYKKKQNFLFRKFDKKHHEFEKLIDGCGIEQKLFENPYTITSCVLCYDYKNSKIKKLKLEDSLCYQ